MKGATEYFYIIERAKHRGIGELQQTKLGYQYHGGNAKCYRVGNILYVTSSHARGEQFFIYLIDENDELFKVYGITGGNPGWTETYGWIRKGTWVKPILQYLRSLARETVAHDERLVLMEREKQREANRIIGQKVDKFNAMFRQA